MKNAVPPRAGARGVSSIGSVIVAAVLVALVAGVLIGVRLGRARPRAVPEPREAAPAGPPRAAVDAALAALPTAVVIVGNGEDVVWANPSAEAMRLAPDGRLAQPLTGLVRRARRADGPVSDDLDLPGLVVRAVATATRDHVVLLLDDTTDARRVDAVRKDFVANVSHELKTPVGALSLLAEAIHGSEGDAEAVSRFADRMLVESRRLSRLVQELIDLSRLEGAEPRRNEPVLVRDFLDEAVDCTRLAAAAADIDVVVNVADPALTVAGDREQLTTAVANLIDNAVAYSPGGTRVGVTARRRGHDVEVAVTDQGIGIGPADRDRVFERFYRVDPARSRETGGTGLGLAIVKHIATNHGGRVELWSVEGTGSTFTVTLPAAAAPAPRTAVAP